MTPASRSGAARGGRPVGTPDVTAGTVEPSGSLGHHEVHHGRRDHPGEQTRGEPQRNRQRRCHLEDSHSYCTAVTGFGLAAQGVQDGPRRVT